jgi:hypothetical protein
MAAASETKRRRESNVRVVVKKEIVKIGGR